MSIFDAIILAIVEGITEFLPISSTGHMIIASSILGIADDPFTKSFEIAIQFGAILSVVVLYWKRFFRSIGFYIKLFIAFIPAAILGFLFSDAIDSLLSNVMVVAVALIAGGFILIFIDKIFAADTREKLDDADAIKPTNAFIVGVYQCLAMIPGVSRSAATIIGGMTRKMTRKAAAEFSFFLAVPTMFAATAYKMYSFYSEGPGFTSDEYTPLILGNVLAFFIAILAMRSFVQYLTKNGFAVFGYYRIIVGTILLILLAAGVDLTDYGMITPEAFLEGQAVLIDKPYGWTSHDVVGKIRMPVKHYCQNKKMKIGHAGTLDPLATGLLIVVTGKFTKKADAFQALEKVYTGSLILGEITASYDKETEVIETHDIAHITPEQIIAATKSFTGIIEQVPPAYSSVKVQGVRAYAYARSGEEVALRKKQIEVYAFEITDIRMPEVSFRIRCSKGTYIRSLAHDLGIALGCGAHLSSLRRTHIGNYCVDDAVSPEAFVSTLRPE